MIKGGEVTELGFETLKRLKCLFSSGYHAPDRFDSTGAVTITGFTASINRLIINIKQYSLWF